MGRSMQPGILSIPANSSTIHFMDSHRIGLSILAMGIVLRLIVFGSIGPLNNDNHLEVIQYIVNQGALPLSTQFNQAYHPPLYHLLASLFLYLSGSVKTVQSLSLILSIGTLALAHGLIRRLPWISGRVKPWCLALIAFHPQFLTYTLFISNDTLAIFLGMLIFVQCWRFLNAPSLGNHALLGLWLGLGLLTKATFLSFIPPLVLCLLLAGAQGRLGRRSRAMGLACFLLIAAAVGSYKYVENAVYFGHPLLSNLDLNPQWARLQRPTCLGPSSLFDFNLFKLVSRPIVSSSTVHSYPLMLYATFWHSFIPESTYRSSLTPFGIVGSLIYFMAIFPTLLIAIGAAGMMRSSAAIGRLAPEADPTGGLRKKRIFELTALLLLMFNIGLILAAGWKYDVWSVFQSRLFFPSYFAILLMFGRGLDWAMRRAALDRLARAMLAILFALFAAYFAIEITLGIIYRPNPMRTNHMPYSVDMTPTSPTRGP